MWRLPPWARLGHRRLNDPAITIEEHAEAVAELDAAIMSAREALEQLDAVPVPDLDDQAVGEIVTGWTTATPAVRHRDLRRVWAGFQIFVTPGSSTENEDQVRQRISRPGRIPSTRRR